MALNSKDIFKDEIERKRKQFLLSDELRYEHLEPATIPWTVYSNKSSPTRYRRRKIALQEQNSLDIISKDDDFDHFIWKTSNTNLKQGIYNGLISFDALTSQVISKLGKYINLSHRRVYNYGTVSNKHQQKVFLLRLTQNRIAALQPLERLINYDNYSTPGEDTKKLVIEALNHYSDTLNQLKMEIASSIDGIEQYDKHAKATLSSFIDADIKQVDKIIQKLSASDSCEIESVVSSILKPFGNGSISSFIKEQIIRHIRQAQLINQNMSYSRSARSIMRGDFNSVCEDGLLAVSKYKPDLHNPVLPEHQGIFEDGQYAVDFSFLENDEEGINNTLMGITQIEGFDHITYGDEPTIRDENAQKKPLAVTRFTKWLINESWQYNALRLLAFSLNIFTGIFVGFTYDLFAGLVAFISGQKLKSGAKKLHVTLDIHSSQHTKYKQISKRIHAKTYSLGTLVGIRLRNFAINIFWDVTNGARVTFSQVTFKFWESLKADYYLGHRKHSDVSDTMTSLSSEINKLLETREQLKQHLKDTFPAFSMLMAQELAPQATYPEPPYHLNSGEWMDITNSAVNGLRFVFETFTDNIHRKHPTAGLIFSSAYIAGIGCILFPKLFSFLPKKYIAFSNAIGETMSKGAQAKAIGSGMTQAQLFTATFEAMCNGHDSWLAQGGQMFEKEPADMITYITIAVGLGYLIAFELEIPGLSKMIREDLGNIPIPSLGFAGAKICILLVDFVKEKKERPTSDKLPDIKQQLEQLVEETLNNLNVEKELIQKHKQRLISIFLSTAVLDNISEQLQPSTSHQDNETSIDNLNKIRLLYLLESNKSLLPHLSMSLKNELLETLKELFPNDADTHQTIYELLNPPPPQSIFVITLTTIVDYIPLLVRCCAGPVTKTYQPLAELKYKVRKDITRVLNAASNALYGISSLLCTVSRNILDIFSNELAARLDSFIFDDTHHLSSSTYKMSETFDTGFTQAHELLTKPVESLKRQSTHSVAHSIFSKHTTEFYGKSKRFVNNEIRPGSLSGSRVTTL